MIEAAGGVMLRDEDGHTSVLLVHRVRHDDWSLPKGKLDAGETASATAVREVEEETGVRGEVGEELPSVYYESEAGPKRVRWYRMAHVSGDPEQREPDAEVDIACFMPVGQALEVLTYPHDRELLRQVLDAEPAQDR